MWFIIICLIVRKRRYKPIPSDGKGVCPLARLSRHGRDGLLWHKPAAKVTQFRQLMKFEGQNCTQIGTVCTQWLSERVGE